MELLADNALHNRPNAGVQQAQPLRNLSMQNLPSISNQTRGRSRYVANIYARNAAKGLRVQRFLHAAFRHFADVWAWEDGGGSGGLRSVLKKLDVDGNSFEAVMMDLHSCLLDRDVTEVYTLRLPPDRDHICPPE